MTMKPGLKFSIWMAVGVVIQLGIMLVIFHFHKEQNPAEQLARQARRIALVGQMRSALASSAEAEKSAVMATTDQDSQTFAAQSRSATSALVRTRQELLGLLQASGSKDEEELLERFSRAFTELQRVDKELLDLAVQNTNLKAYSLAFGPAAEALKGMDAALLRVVTPNAEGASAEARRIVLLANDARIRALRIQTLLPPHIAEESPRKMGDLETLMAIEDREVRKDLDSLAVLLKAGRNPNLKAAASCYGQFSGLKTQILKLSRANTNVRSLAISLNQKRKVTSVCQDALAALEQAIQQEPIAAAPANPR
ncbi:MAG: MCP four helix bundle domain-containing protein [Elusimicrobia bacterium]|nr:MCP four helix bundle domain-containing protein [Elusimicrobiota bacterium]